MTRSRRAAQEEHNERHGITPKTIEKAIAALTGTPQDDYVDLTRAAKEAANNEVALEELPRTITALKKQMLELSEALEFEKAAAMRDRLEELKDIRVSLGAAETAEKPRRRTRPNLPKTDGTDDHTGSLSPVMRKFSPRRSAAAAAAAALSAGSRTTSGGSTVRRASPPADEHPRRHGHPRHWR